MAGVFKFDRYLIDNSKNVVYIRNAELKFYYSGYLDYFSLLTAKPHEMRAIVTV